MSSYLNFYLKDKSNHFNYLNGFTRSTAIYEYGHDYAQYEYGVALNVNVCNQIIADIDRELSQHDSAVNNCNERKSLIVQMNNSMEDKLAAINEVEEFLASINEITEALAAARGFYVTMRGIAQSASEAADADDDNYIYFGIEWYPEYTTGTEMVTDDVEPEVEVLGLDSVD